jgi:hypothetical protein
MRLHMPKGGSIRENNKWVGVMGQVAWDGGRYMYLE